MALIYIVEDDQNIEEIESYALRSNGHDVRVFRESSSFDEAMKDVYPDLVLLDIMLP
ncbi:MAG: DNA-binding response regulator, partial [Erysipelotrichaceae bacterium]|nr:DNA-binding response regulator [Erysipelotrichaceae bacterium]